MLRADAGRTQGTGHVMRVLTLAEALRARGHRVTLATAELDIPWLDAVVRRSGVEVAVAVRDQIDPVSIAALEPDWVVVDSYLIPAQSISELNRRAPVLMIADGDARGAEAAMYLDQNLGAPPLSRAGAGRQLRGPDYVLVRKAILALRDLDRARIRHSPPRVLVVLGGTDPEDRTIDVARACASLASRASFTFVAPQRQHPALRSSTTGGERDAAEWVVRGPTPDLPGLLAEADAVVTAGGTSAWDIATIGVPSVVLAVVPNQQASLRAIVEAGIAIGFDVVGRPADARALATGIGDVICDSLLRADLVTRCEELFDGRGASRVVVALEQG